MTVVLVLIAQPSWADYVLDKDYCFLSKSFDFESSSQPIMGLFQMAFSSPPVSLPIMNISFSGDFKPDDVSISWKSAKLTNRSHQALFDAEFTQELNTSDRVFPFYRNGGEVYYSPAYGFLSSRIFIAMFLSQSDMELNFKDGGGQEHQVLISLSGSDQAFRNLAVECYQERSKEYLNEHMTRRKNLVESWSKAYGLLDYPISENLQETSYVLKEEHKKDIAKTYDFYSGLYPLLQNKSEVLERILQVESESTVSDKLNTLKEKLTQMQSKQTRMRTLKTSDTEGLIQKTLVELQSIEKELIAVEQKIGDLKDRSLKESEAQLESLKNSNDVLVKQLEHLDNRISGLDLKIKEASLSLDKLYESYVFIGAKLQSHEVERLQGMKYAGPPLTINEIQVELNKVSELEMEILFLERSLEQLKSIEPVISVGVEKYQTAMKAYKDYLAVQKEITSLKFAVEKLQIEKRKKEDEVGLSLKHLVDTSIIIESQSPKERSLDDEKARIIESLRTTNADFDAKLEHLAGQGFVVLSQIICRSNIFRADVNDYCLTAQDLESESEIISYFENMSSTHRDDVIVKSQVDYSYPWRGSEQKNKIQTLVDKLTQELKSKEFKDLSSVWNLILTYRWRYNQVRNLSITSVNSKTYDGFIDALKSELGKFDQDVSKISAEIKKQESQLLALQETYLLKEREYQDAASMLSDSVASTLVSNEETEEIDACLSARFDILICEKEYKNFVLTRESDKLNKDQDYKSDVENITLAILSGIQMTSEIKGESEQQLSMQRLEREEFLQTSKLEELLIHQEQLQAQHLKLILDLEKLELSQNQIQSQRSLKALEFESFQAEYNTLKSEAQALKVELQIISSELNEYCESQASLYDKMSQINLKIVELGGVIKDDVKFTSPCQSIQNMVLR